MPIYTFWYKKEITSETLQDAINIEKQIPFKLDGIKEEQDKEVENKIPAIGFYTN